jgi:hypothetical protein
MRLIALDERARSGQLSKGPMVAGGPLYAARPTRRAAFSEILYLGRHANDVIGRARHPESFPNSK